LRSHSLRKDNHFSFNNFMDEMLAFENYLYGDNLTIFGNKIQDNEFLVDRIVLLPSFRPFSVEKVVKISFEYSFDLDFHRMLLERSFECPILNYRLYQSGFFNFEEIEPILMRKESSILFYYYRKEINDFNIVIKNKRNPQYFEENMIEDENKICLLIKFGFIPSSIEYCLKYDDILAFRPLFEPKMHNARWSPFEWSRKPVSLDVLSFSGFFGSIQCFKYLISNGYEINDTVRSMVVCSGCFDLIHISIDNKRDGISLMCMASEFCHLFVLKYLVENGGDINLKNKSKINSILI